MENPEKTELSILIDEQRQTRAQLAKLQQEQIETRTRYVQVSVILILCLIPIVFASIVYLITAWR